MGRDSFYQRVADQCLYTTQYLSLWEEDESDYTYVHENLAYSGCKVGLLPYRMLPDGSVMVLAIRERCSPITEMPLICSITGKCEEDQDDVSGIFINDAIRELEEETGYVVDEEQLVFLDVLYPSKSMDTQIFCYMVDVTEAEEGNAAGDGTITESEAELTWLSLDDAVANCQDPVLHSMILQLLFSKLVFN